MTNEEKREWLLEELRAVPDPARGDEIREALHIFDELDMWFDFVDSVSIEQAVMCYKLINLVVRGPGIPGELRM